MISNTVLPMQSIKNSALKTQPQFGLRRKKKKEDDTPTVETTPKIKKGKKNAGPKSYKLAKARKSKWFKGLTGLTALLAAVGAAEQLEARTDVLGSHSQIQDINHIENQFDDFERRAEVIRENSFLSDSDNSELTKGLRSDFYFAMNSILQSVDNYGDVNINQGDFDELLTLLDDGAFSQEELEITNLILKNAVEEGYIGDYNRVFNEWYEDVAENRIGSIRDRADLRREASTVLQELEQRKQINDTADLATDISALMAAMFLTASVLPSRKLKKLEKIEHATAQIQSEPIVITDEMLKEAPEEVTEASPEDFES